MDNYNVRDGVNHQFAPLEKHSLNHHVAAEEAEGRAEARALDDPADNMLMVNILSSHFLNKNFCLLVS